ncbi:MAG TPA: hypothetical protein VLZ89_07040 [Anaerolineales bacterium]|nr:hypothetical protein [Anaerolineales bacterium]
MKPYHFTLLLSLLLAACQAAPATPVPTAATVGAPTPKPTSLSKSTSTPKLTPTPAGPTVHSSNPDPNAPNLIVVKDQFIVNNGLTFDSVTAAQAGWIVLYLDKAASSSGKNVVFGPRIVFAPVPQGKSNQFVISLSQNFNPSINPPSLVGHKVDAVLQGGGPAPGPMVEQNDKLVWVTFTILARNKSSIFATATP